MSPKKFCESIVDKIKTEHIKPRSKWCFMLRNVVFWAMFVLSVVLGAKAFGLTLFHFFEVDLDFLARAPGPLFRPIFRLFPIFWIVSFLVFLFAAVVGLHCTKRGYKWSILKLVSLNLIFVFFFGFLSYQLGFAKREDRFLEQHAPMYSSMEHKKMNVWNDVDGGRLAGRVVAIPNKEVLFLDDFENTRWTVTIQKTSYWVPFTLSDNMRIRVVGNKINDDTFEATVIGPWHRPPRGGHMRHQIILSGTRVIIPLD